MFGPFQAKYRDGFIRRKERDPASTVREWPVLRMSRLAPINTQVLVVSSVPGAGQGAESILGHFIRNWTYDKTSLSFLAPPGSGVSNLARELGFNVLPLDIV